MNSKVITVVLIIVFSCFAFAADKPSKRVLLRPGDNSVSQVDNGEFMPLPENSVTQPSALYKVPPAHSLWLDHTDGTTEYYLSSGAAADTMAVWYKGAGACSVYTIETQWFDADDAATVLFYIWEASDEAPDPGLSMSRGEFEGKTPLGNVVVGPIPYTPQVAANQDWEGFDIIDFGAVPFFGDIEGNPAPFFVGFVKNDALPHILADNVGAKGYNYSWLGGPWTDGAWGGYNPIIEYAFRVAVTYPYGASPSVSGISILPETYEGDQDFEVSALVTDESAVVGAWLHWNIDDPEPGDDSVAMTADGDIYTGTFNPTAAVGDTVYYWVSALDDVGNKTVENLLSPNNFHVIAPENPGADILLVLENTFIDPADYPGFTWEFILDSMGYTYEVWDIAAMRGIDRFTTNAGWTDGIVIAGWGVSVMPTRSYDTDKHPFATFLNNGGNLFFTDQDYFYSNGEVDEPVFVAGDFAFDFFSISGGSNDLGGGLDTMIIGAEGDEITDFMSADFIPMRADDWGGEGTDWTDYLVADQAEFIVTSETGEDVAVKYDAGSFKTVFCAYPIETMNSVEGWSDTTNGEWDGNFWTMVEKSFTWLGFVPTTAIDGDNGVVPQRFSLGQNYPNPFNPSTEITFRLGKAVDVDLTIYSVTGQKVHTLVKGQQKAGEHTVTWNGMNDVGQRVASGLYFYTIEAGDFKAIKKMVLIK
jgi:hypothetical protein